MSDEVMRMLRTEVIKAVVVVSLLLLLKTFNLKSRFVSLIVNSCENENV